MPMVMVGIRAMPLMGETTRTRISRSGSKAGMNSYLSESRDESVGECHLPKGAAVDGEIGEGGTSRKLKRREEREREKYRYSPNLQLSSLAIMHPPTIAGLAPVNFMTSPESGKAIPWVIPQTDWTMMKSA